jgi:hypothetical protein
MSFWISPRQGPMGAPYPRFPVEPDGFHELHAAFLNESRTRRHRIEPRTGNRDISLVFREMWEMRTLMFFASGVENWPAERSGIPHLAKDERDMGHPGSVEGIGFPETECCLDFEGEGRRRPAGSEATEQPYGDSIRDALLAHAGSGEPDARPACEIRRDGAGSDGTKALAVRATGLPEFGTGCRTSHFSHAPASMRAVSTAADGQQLLRGGKREHGCRRQQPTKNAQQHERRNPPHEVSLHATPCAEHKQ